MIWDLLMRYLGWLRRTFCFTGPVFLIMSAYFAMRTEDFVTRSVSATATVVGNVPIQTRNSTTGQTSTTYAPQFTFLANDGQRYTVTSSVSTDPPAFEVGQSVNARYIPGEAGSAKLDTLWQMWSAALGFAIGGAFLTLVGFGWTLLAWRRRAGVAVSA
jgi:Protein of unknown function (DUF3592)